MNEELKKLQEQVSDPCYICVKIYRRQYVYVLAGPGRDDIILGADFKTANIQLQAHLVLMKMEA